MSRGAALATPENARTAIHDRWPLALLIEMSDAALRD
jgi:hypothetical protein